MGQVIRSAPAKADLLEIWDYIAEENPASAEKVLRRLEKAFQMLAESPLMGRERSELAHALRSFPIGKYVIFYRLIKDGIELVRVVHSSQDIDTLL